MRVCVCNASNNTVATFVATLIRSCGRIVSEAVPVGPSLDGFTTQLKPIGDHQPFASKPSKLTKKKKKNPAIKIYVCALSINAVINSCAGTIHTTFPGGEIIILLLFQEFWERLRE